MPLRFRHQFLEMLPSLDSSYSIERLEWNLSYCLPPGGFPDLTLRIGMTSHQQAQNGWCSNQHHSRYIRVGVGPLLGFDTR